MSYSHNEIIFLYNNVIRQFSSYYSHVNNYNKYIRTLTLILKRSCAKLLAAKFTLKTQSQVYKKFGPLLKSPDGSTFFNKE